MSKITEKRTQYKNSKLCRQCLHIECKSLMVEAMKLNRISILSIGLKDKSKIINIFANLTKKILISDKLLFVNDFFNVYLRLNYKGFSTIENPL